MLQDVIQQLDLEKINFFFRIKSNDYRPIEETIESNDENFQNGIYLGEMDLPDGSLMVVAFQVLKPLSHRSGKKAQYEIAKNLLKEYQKDAGIFIFYDEKKDFRFSLIFAEYFGTKRTFSHFKRYTYFVTPKRINKTFIQQVEQNCSFATIKDIKQAFSVEPLTKQFYLDIANWYFWAIKNVQFPKDAEEIPNGRNIAVIRLITRIIFIWFMKVQNLIPEELFNEKDLKSIIKDFSPISKNSSNYYKAILQNLFFATLNTKQEDRRFRSEERGHKGYNTDFGNHHVYRYKDLFLNSEETIEKYFMPIPFLNGGLFECLDYKSKIKQERKYIDGFTDLKNYQPFVPDFLFFAEEEIVDLSSDYNENKYKKTPVRGLIKILQQYNFTIIENDPDDVEIALDPELLGNVFENLLASYNPETSTSARKATGSYYTPRIIVDYMVDESLKRYFKTHLPSLNEEDLKSLFNKESSNNPLDEKTTLSLINLIDSLRIVDPAVGSGAFPMRILNRLVFLLSKLDPQNEIWKNTQIEGVRKNIKDPVIQKELIQQIEKRFLEKDPNYGRKLYLIQKCIYGVDIQQIAVEIAKLRFFISLLVDEILELNPQKENYGIEPLPNLEFKIMQGNSLISTYYGIEFRKNEKDSLFSLDDNYKNLINEFEELKSQYQNETDIERKNQLKETIDDKIVEIFDVLLQEYEPELKQIEKRAKQIRNLQEREKYLQQEKEKIFKKRGFDVEKAKEELIAYTVGRKEKNFFLWDLYFAEVFLEKNGFDIVIGNPPYIQLQKAYNQNIKFGDLYKNEQYKTFERTGDIYCLFYEKGMQLLRKEGILAFITSNKWMRAGYGEALRAFFVQYNPLVLIDLGPGVFENATVDTNILLIQKSKNKKQLIAVTLEKQDRESIEKALKEKGILLNKLSSDAWFIGDQSEQRLKEKIERIGKPLKDWDVKIYRGIVTGLNEAFIINTEKRNEILKNCKSEDERQRTEAIIKPILRGRDIKRYYYEWAGLWVIVIPSGWTEKNRKNEKPETFIQKSFPALMQYLEQYEAKAKKRDDQGDYWWELRKCTYYPEFEKEKVVYGQFRNGEFAYDNKKMYLRSNEYMIVGKDLKYILALINSKTTYKYQTFISNNLSGQTTIAQKDIFTTLPLPPITKKNESIVKTIEELVDKILLAKKQNPHTNTSHFEREIDQLVYQLYELTPEEINIIEGHQI